MKKNNISKLSIGIIGCGKMGSAIVKALLSQAHSVYYVDRNDSDLDIPKYCEQDLDLVFIAVKPQQFNDIKHFPKAKMYISIMAGVTLEKLVHSIGEDKIIRCMPNIAALNSVSTTVFTSKNLTEAEKEIVYSILSSFGYVKEVKEEDINLITSIAGSGPAYFANFCNVLENILVSKNFDQKSSKDIVENTLAGVLSLSKNGYSFKEIVSMVTSPNGTTQAALGIFEQKNFNEIVVKAVEAAIERAEELNE